MTEGKTWPLTPAPPLNARTLAVLAAIFLLGAYLRLHGLSSTSLWYDEAASLYNARWVDLDGSLFDSTKTTEAPGMAVLSKIWYDTIVRGFTDYPATSSRNDFLIRLLPCLLQILSIPLVFALARRLLADNMAAILGTLLFVVSPFQVYYAQEYRIYAWIVLVELCGVWCMFNALEKNRWRDWFGFGLALTVLLYSHYFSVWAVFTCSLFYLTTLPWRLDRIVRWTLVNALVLIAAVPALICAYRMNQLVQEIDPPWYPPSDLHMGLITFKDFFAGYSPSVMAYKPLFVIAAGLFVVGLGLLAARRRWPALFFLLFFSTVPILGSIIVWSGVRVSFYEHRLFIFSGVTSAILVGAGLRTLALPRWYGPFAARFQYVSCAAMGGVLAVILFLTAHCLGNLYRHEIHGAPLQRQGVFDKVAYRDAVQYIDAHQQPGDVLTYPTMFCRYSMQHYSAMEQYKVGGYPTDELMYIRALSNEPLLRRHGILPTPIDQVAAKAKRIWLVRAYGITFETGPFSYFAEEILKKTWRVTDEQFIGGLHLRLFERNEAQAAVAPPPPDVSAPNVLLVVIDTLRNDQITNTRNGVAVMPQLRAFAEKSVWFNHAWAAATWTKPSVTSILTGLYPTTHQVQFGVQKAWFAGQDLSKVQTLATEQTSLATVMKGAGYATFCVQTNPHIAAASGFDQGFDQFELHLGQPGAFVTDKALTFLRPTKGPWFLYAHYLDPHAPYAPPPNLREAFGPFPELSPEEQTRLDNNTFQTAYYQDRFQFDAGFTDQREYPGDSANVKQTFRQLYDGDCLYTDRQVARLIETVKKKWPNTLVIVTADHGEEFEEHGGLGHAKTVYEELANVPLIVNGPDIAARTVEAPVETIDIAPTVAAATGVPARAEWQGRNLLAAPDPARVTYCETQGSIPEFKIHAQAVLQWPYKLVRDVKRGRTQLFDLAADPGEQNDLAAAAPDKVAALVTLWEAHEGTAKENAAAAIPPRLVSLDKETEDQLNALGYLSDTKDKKK